MLALHPHGHGRWIQSFSQYKTKCTRVDTYMGRDWAEDRDRNGVSCIVTTMGTPFATQTAAAL